MQILTTIRDKDLDLQFEDQILYRQERAASRALVFDKNNDVALLHSTIKNYHKLPGGGIEKDENPVQALKRETMEEIGCEIENIRELGIIEEYRNQFSLHQISYCFIATLKGEKGIPNFEEAELAEGFQTIWINIDNAIKTLENEKNLEHYEGKFINMRDLILLREAKKII